MNTPPFSAEQLKQKFDDVSGSITEYSADKKEQFESAMRETMKPIDDQIAKLQSRSESMKDEAAQEIDRLSLKLQTERDMFEARLKAAHTETGNAWLHLKDGLQSAWNDLAESAENAVSAFREAGTKSD